MKNLRQYIRWIILTEQSNRELFNMETAGIADYKSKGEFTDDGGSFDREAAKTKITGMVTTAKVAKDAFRKYSDQSFIKSLVYVHWTKDKQQLLGDILDPAALDGELSAAAYLPGEVPKEGMFGPYGTIVSGRVTILANSMDSIYTGYLDVYDAAGEDVREKGFQKFSPKDIVLSAEDWNPEITGGGYNNSEALLKDWEPIGMILPSGEVQWLLDNIEGKIDDHEGDLDILENIYYDDFTINGKQLLDWLPGLSDY
jgi:hypothetical protein